MNRQQYLKARRLFRDNGRYALRWLDQAEREVMDVLLVIQDQKDRLAERADIVAYCKREGIYVNLRHTA